MVYASKNRAITRKIPQGNVNIALIRNSAVANGVAMIDAKVPQSRLISAVAARGLSKKSR